MFRDCSFDYFRRAELNAYLLSEGRNLPNMTVNILDDLNLYFHNFVCSLVGIENKFKVITEHPCKFMDKYIDRSLLIVCFARDSTYELSPRKCIR